MSLAVCGRQSTPVPELRNVDTSVVTSLPWSGVSTNAKWYVVPAVVPGNVTEKSPGAVNSPTATVPTSSAAVTPHLNDTETREAVEAKRESVPETRMPSAVWRAESMLPPQSHAVFAATAPATAKFAFATESHSALIQSADAIPS